MSLLGGGFWCFFVGTFKQHPSFPNKHPTHHKKHTKQKTKQKQNTKGHLQILYGNLAPEGSVAKITGKEGLKFAGQALCFDGEEAMLAALSADTERFKGKVVVIRYEGPTGGPGRCCVCCVCERQGNAVCFVCVLVACALLAHQKPKKLPPPKPKTQNQQKNKACRRC